MEHLKKDIGWYLISNVGGAVTLIKGEWGKWKRIIEDRLHCIWTEAGKKRILHRLEIKSF